MWRNIYQELEDKLQALADEFGRSLDDFINGLRLDRAHSWEALLYGFLHDWRQRGILVEEPQRQKLNKLLGELRAELVPAEDLRAAMDCWKRQAADALSRSGPLELDEPSSPEEAALPTGVRQLGQGIMRRHPPENWLHVVDDVSSSWRFAEGVATKFRSWIAIEQSKTFAANARNKPTNVVAGGADAADTSSQPAGEQLAMADDAPVDGTSGNGARVESHSDDGPPFDEETMRALLRLMDPHVYRWWMSWGKLIRVNTTRGAAMFKSNADEFKMVYTLPRGKPPQIHGYTYRASDAKTEFEVARAIIQEFYKHDSGGWANPESSFPGPKFTENEGAWIKQWQKDAFNVGAPQAAFIANLYVKGILSINPGADAVVSISELLDQGFSLSTLVGALPFIPAIVFRRAGKAQVLLKFGSHEFSVGEGLFGKFEKLSAEYQKAIAIAVAKAATKTHAEKQLKYLIDGVASGTIKLHHISTNKNWISTLRGGPWSSKFADIFRKAGMTLNDAANKVLIPGHFGPHPEEYHRTIYKRLADAVRGRTGEAYKAALLRQLELISNDAITPGTKLNRLLTER